MNHKQVQDIATKHGLGKVHFQFNSTMNSDRQFEVGYVSKGRQRSLFCKRSSNSNPDQFYLCNEYAKLDRAEAETDRAEAETERTLLLTIKTLVDEIDTLADVCATSKKAFLCLQRRPQDVRWEHSEIAIYEAQSREDARALAEGREPRLISRMEDIKDLEEAVTMPADDPNLPSWARQMHKISDEVYEPLYLIQGRMKKLLTSEKKMSKAARAYLQKSIQLSATLLQHMENGW